MTFTISPTEDNDPYTNDRYYIRIEGSNGTHGSTAIEGSNGTHGSTAIEGSNGTHGSTAIEGSNGTHGSTAIEGYVYLFNSKYIGKATSAAEWQVDLGKILTLAVVTNRDPVLIIRGPPCGFSYDDVLRISERYKIFISVVGSTDTAVSNDYIDDVLQYDIVDDDNNTPSVDSDESDHEEDVDLAPEITQCEYIFIRGMRRGERCPNQALPKEDRCRVHYIPNHGFVRNVTTPSVPITSTSWDLPTEIELEPIDGHEKYYRITARNEVIHSPDGETFYLVGSIDSVGVCRDIDAPTQERWSRQNGIIVASASDEARSGIIGRKLY